MASRAASGALQPADPNRFSGKYFWTYTRDGGGWKLARAIVSLDQQDDGGLPAVTETGAKAPERLETARLVLRRPVVTDVEAIFSRFASDPEVTRYVGWPRNPTLESTAGFIDFVDAEWSRGASGPYLIESREDFLRGYVDVVLSAFDDAAAFDTR